MQRNSHCSGECCVYLHVKGQVRVEVGVRYKWREVCYCNIYFGKVRSSFVLVLIK